jgi:twitching motility protein PilT
MPQLDRFLSVMVSNRAEAIRLVEGQLVLLESGGSTRPMTKQPLTGAQLLGLLREIAPADAVAQLGAGRDATFAYSNADGAFVASVRQQAGAWHAALKVDADGEYRRLTGAQVAVAAPDAAPPAAPSPVGAEGENGRRATPVARVTIDPAREAAARAEIESLLRLMVERGASDLHIRVGEPPILRTSGEMVRVDATSTLENAQVEAMLLSIMPDRNRAEYAASNDTDFAYEIEGVARFRANALRDRKGAAAVFRVIPATVVTVEQMGITPEVQKLCYLTKGLVLVTGPTGSGKSTTLCSLIDLVNRARHDHVITIEDPIEFVHPNKNCIITQRQVGVHTGSFKSALRAALREDPDIVLVGELRDLETVSIAIETAETGHLVFGTLHTTTAAGTIDRIIDQFPADRQEQIRVMLSESLKGVISQTLCKKIGGGRVAAREILLSIPAVSNLIREGKTFQIPSVMQTSRRLGMVTLNDALMELVDGRQIEPKEAWMKAVDKTSLLATMRAKGHDVSYAENEAMAGAAGGAGSAGGTAGAGARPTAGVRR